MASPKPRLPANIPHGGEDAALERVAHTMRNASGRPPRGEVWIGDDAAVVAPPSGKLVLSTDAVVEGIHADLTLVTLSDLGWKALTVAVSDIAAMGARPSHALLTCCLPPYADLDALMSGMAEASAQWHCPVVGGDLSGSDRVMVSVAVVGVLEGEEAPTTRRMAHAGDSLMVTGPLGASAAGLRLLRAGTPTRDPQTCALIDAHRRPTARLREGVVARTAGASAMIDLSDGLSIDLHRVADASGVGFALDTVPVAPGATETEAIEGGEDYELLVATPDPERMTRDFAAVGLRPPILIGTCTAITGSSGRTLQGAELSRRGWQHTII